ncbi:hypothetical protein ACOMHN_015333 [Nucella lapillus]
MVGRNLESLVEEVGPFGRFQLLLIFMANAILVTAIWSMMFMVFGSLQPDWWCQSRDGLANNQSTLPVSNLNSSEGRVIVDMDSSTVGFGLEQGSGNASHDGVGVLEMCEALRKEDGVCERIVFAPGMVTIVTEFQLVCDLSWVTSLTISLQMVGVLSGSILAGQMADTIGRKKTLVIFAVLHSVFNLTAAFSVSWQMFAVLRTLIGVTVGAIFVIGFTYPTEFIGVKRRAVAVALPVWGGATLTLCLVVWLFPHWSHVHLIIAAGSLLSLSAWLFLPESVRWLAMKGHTAKVHHVLTKMAKWNGRQPPSWSSVQVLCSNPKDHSQKKYTYFHIFSTCRMMKVSCLIGYMWWACAVSYYGISFGIKNLSGDFHLNFMLNSLVELPTGPLLYFLSGWLGRRWISFCGLLICSLSAFAIVPLSYLMSEEAAGNYVNALCIVCRGALNLGWSALILITTEQYPTVVR